MKRNTLLVKLGAKAVKSRTFRDSDLFMDQFIDTLTQLGGVYAKFLQGVLLGMVYRRSKVVSESQLNVFEDNPDPHLSLVDIQTILGRAAGQVKITSTTPLGVGSYSAVYPALLHDGTEVVVKLLRPGVKDEIQRDLRFLRQLSRILDFAAPSKLPMDIGQMYGSFKKACIKEIDFKSEITFAGEMYQRYIGHQHIVIPKTYAELSNDNVIVQERIRGLSGKDILALKNTGQDAEEIVRKQTGSDLTHILRVLTYDMMYSFGSGLSFHGDTHPGNVRILPDDKIALIDFGIKADPYSVKAVSAFVNKLESDILFMDGDFDLIRILDAHFRLYMAGMYQSIDSLFFVIKKDISEFFTALAIHLNISTMPVSEDKKLEWLSRGPAYMLTDLLGSSPAEFGIDVRLDDQTTSRATSTLFTLLTVLQDGHTRGQTILKPVYSKVCERIRSEHSELFHSRKHLSPDLALENIYLWLEKVSSKNPELGYKLRMFMSDMSKKEPAITKPVELPG